MSVRTPSRRRTPSRTRGTIRAASLLAVVLVAAGSLLLSACGSEEQEQAGADTPAPGEPAAAAALDQDAVVIDVRTPEEYDAGHVQDAQLIDIQSPEFAAGIAELDPDQTYVVYCRSGNRSAVAAEQMRAEGLTVLDGGGLDAMTAAGWPTA
jgi:rhodanese-related sulfurtransferase